MFKRIKRFFTLLWFSFFQGMIAADKVINGSTAKVGDVEVNQNLKAGGVMNDILEQKVTQEVEEIRDEHYRVYKESKKVDTSTISMSFDESGDPVFHGADKPLKKKTKADFIKRINVYGENELPVRTIQDNVKVDKHSSLFNMSETFDSSTVPTGLYDYCTTLTITRNGFVPRFEIEKFVTKMVVRQEERSSRAKVDFYLPMLASQFGKIDAILIANLHQIKDSGNFRSDILDFEGIEWVSYKAWNADDICHFSYSDIKPESINEFDGNFVITFDCKIEDDGKYIPEKYMKKEVTEKYKTEAPKHDGIDLGTILRRQKRQEEKKNNFEKTILKIK